MDNTDIEDIDEGWETEQESNSRGSKSDDIEDFILGAFEALEKKARED